MAFVSRKNQNIDNKVNSSTVNKSKPIDLDSLKIKTHDKEAQQKAHFLEEAKLVLNILESRGVDIYDENNTPGMYLKGNQKKNKPENVNKFLDFLKNKNNK